MLKGICLIFACAVGVSLALPVEDNSWRVVGGENAKIGEAPWQVVLRRNAVFTCSGSILNSKTILTAAHCVTSSASSLSIVAGTNNLFTGGVIYFVEKVKMHESYGSPTRESNDIAILILQKDIEFTDLIKSIQVEETDISEVSLPAVLTGWGRTGVTASPAENLQIVNLMTISHSSCTAAWGSVVTPTMICTYTKVGEGACHGDSGGPLINGAKKIVGVVSWGRPCANGRPDVYSRASSYVDWIAKNSE